MPARWILLAEEGALIVLYSVALVRGIQRYVRTRRADRKRRAHRILRSLFVGAVLMSAGVIFQAVGLSVLLIWFWESDAPARLLIWQASVLLLIAGGHLLFRRDFEDLGSLVVDELVNDDERCRS